MSSSRRSEPTLEHGPPVDPPATPDPSATDAAVAARASRRRPLTLRTKLILSITAVIVAVSAVIGIVTEIVLSNYLVRQLDDRLVAAQERTNLGVQREPDPPWEPEDESCSGPAYLLLGGASDGTLGVKIGTEGVVRSAGIVQGPETCTELTAEQAAVFTSLSPTASPVTIDVPGIGDYRVQASAGRYGGVLVTGLPLQDVEDTRDTLVLVMAIVTGVAVLAGGGVVYWLVSRNLRPLERVAATARTVASLPLDRGEVDLGVRVPDADTDPRTEVGQVGAALNQMLGHVSGALQSRHDSETRVRKFVADASHELRTPLAAIRGYTELARRRPTDTAGVDHALRRVQSESLRMSSLVDDLLLLARLDSGRPLSDDEVDLTVLVVDSVADARVAGPDHRWQLDLPEEPVTVRGDQQRLTQILANLLANARTHTPAGTTVTVSLRTSRGSAVLTVHDDGPGIPETLQPEIFNRFVRGDSSRSRAAGSTGLGLSIVDAVTAAHGGTVRVRSRPGDTTFTVRLPRQG